MTGLRTATDSDLVSRRKVFVSAGALLLLVAWTFRYVGEFGFINLDDPDYVTNNPHVAAGLTWEGLRWAFTSFHAGHWHPLTWLSLMLDSSLFGLNPRMFHLENVALHSMNALLFFFGLQRLTGRPGASLAAAALFAVHPLRVESVVWVTERKDVLSTLFLLLATGAYLRSQRLVDLDSLPRTQAFGWASHRRSYAAAGVLFALALLTKPTVLVWPVALLALDFWPLQRIRLPTASMLLEKVPFLTLSAVSLTVTLLSQRQAGALAGKSFVTADSLSNATVGVVHYLHTSVWPFGLAPFYPLQDIEAAAVLASTVFLVVVSGLAFLAFGRAPYLLAGWGWFLVTLAPMSGVVQFGGQAYADRYTYVPHLGLMVATTWLLADLLDRRRYATTLGAMLAVAAVAFLSMTATGQADHWRSSETLFRHAVAVTDNNYMAHNNLGVALADRGAYREALLHYGEAVRVNPTWPEALNNLANEKARSGHLKAAVELYRRALDIRPGYAIAHNNLATAYSRSGQREPAAYHFERAVSLDPRYVEARLALAQTLLQLGRTAEARSHARELSRHHPEWVETRRLLQALEN